MKTLPSFDELKNYTIENCKRLSACQPEFKRILSSSNSEELLQVIKDNIHWVITNKLFTTDDIQDWFGKDLLNKSGIYVSEIVSLEVKNSVSLVFLGSSSATIKTLGSSSATIKTLGSSSATIETLGSSSATIKTWDSSSATIETWDSSSANYELKSTSFGTIKDLTKKKLIVYKSAFEIIEIM